MMDGTQNYPQWRRGLRHAGTLSDDPTHRRVGPTEALAAYGLTVTQRETVIRSRNEGERVTTLGGSMGTRSGADVLFYSSG
jgi:hypothetical protein